MTKRLNTSFWAKSLRRSMTAMTRMATATSNHMLRHALKPAVALHRTPPPGADAWLPGVAIGLSGALRYRLYRPPNVTAGDRLPLLVMLHGCGQDADSFACSTRMNRIAMRERFLVLCPEQDRLRNPQGCWNWFDTDSGRAYAEADLILSAIDQACLLYPVDRQQVALAGLSAGASMAALLATRHPERFKAVVMHSGIPPGAAHSTLTALGAMHGHRTTVPLTTLPWHMARHWPPLMVIHGDADITVSPHNAAAATATWAHAAGAGAGAIAGGGTEAGARAGVPRQVQRGKRHPMLVTDFTHRGTLVASLVQVAKLGHAWSGGAAGQPFSDPLGPDASRMVWAFAARQFRARAAASTQNKQ